MKIKNILVPLSALAMIVLVLIYSGVLSSFQVSKSSVVGPASAKIVYQCEGQSSIDVPSICIVNGDGSNQRILDAGQRFAKEHRWLPSINSMGEVVFECRAASAGAPRGHLSDICYVNVDGTGFMRLNAPDLSDNLHPQINNAGQIVFQCGDAICAIDGIAGRARMIVDDQDGVAQDPVINDAGLVAFVCIGATRADICLVQQEGSDVVNLTESIPDQFFTSPEINDAGWIVSECGRSDAPDQIDICLLHSSGENFRQLTSASADESFGIPSINESGQIVFQCRLDGQNQICYTDLFLEDFIQLTEDDAGARSGRNSFPSINNAALIAYNCDRNLCVIQFDGFEKKEVRDILLQEVLITDVVIN